MAINKSVYRVVQRPLLTEKAGLSGGNTVVFQVMREASKDEIKEAVEEIFNVKVSDVRTANMRGKMKRVRNIPSRRSDWKKAYVSLKEGSAQEILEGL